MSILYCLPGKHCPRKNVSNAIHSLTLERQSLLYYESIAPETKVDFGICYFDDIWQHWHRNNAVQQSTKPQILVFAKAWMVVSTRSGEWYSSLMTSHSGPISDTKGGVSHALASVRKNRKHFFTFHSLRFHSPTQIVGIDLIVQILQMLSGRTNVVWNLYGKQIKVKC